ncbi:MAG TPA: peptidylprolyl isomerase [Candidatus Krumholzibacteria bacterium]|nr:peptidylprolyl isomerase [Candidatus Krumholzibacteria bacterium]
MPPVLLVALAALALAGCERRDVGGTPRDPGPVVAKVNGRPLYQIDLDAYLPTEETNALTADERKTYFDRWVATQLLCEAAERDGMGLSAEIDRKIEQYKKDLVADRLVEDVLKAKAIVTRDEVMAYYRAHKDEYNLEVRVSHILTNSIEDAEEAQTMLRTRPFSWVARQMSVDKHTGAGGDLGYLSKGNMLPEFEKVVFKMRVGEVSDIIESEFGYHLLKLTDVRTLAAEPPFEAIAPEISRQLLLQKRVAVYDSLIASLVAQANIEVVDPGLQYAIEVADSVRALQPQGTPVPGAFTSAIPEPGDGRHRADAPLDSTNEGDME